MSSNEEVPAEKNVITVNMSMKVGSVAVDDDGTVTPAYFAVFENIDPEGNKTEVMVPWEKLKSTVLEWISFESKTD